MLYAEFQEKFVDNLVSHFWGQNTFFQDRLTFLIKETPLKKIYRSYNHITLLLILRDKHSALKDFFKDYFKNLEFTWEDYNALRPIYEDLGGSPLVSSPVSEVLDTLEDFLDKAYYLSDDLSITSD